MENIGRSKTVKSQVKPLSLTVTGTDLVRLKNAVLISHSVPGSRSEALRAFFTSSPGQASETDVLTGAEVEAWRVFAQGHIAAER